MDLKNLKDKLIAYLLPVGIVIVAVVLYIFIPSITAFVARNAVGLRGGIILVVAGWLLGIYYAYVMGFRGKALAYAIGVIIFTITCIWLAVNFDMVWDWLVAAVGIWGTIGITLVMCLFVYLGIKML